MKISCHVELEARTDPSQARSDTSDDTCRLVPVHCHPRVKHHKSMQKVQAAASSFALRKSEENVPAAVEPMSLWHLASSSYGAAFRKMRPRAPPLTGRNVSKATKPEAGEDVPGQVRPLAEASGPSFSSTSISPLSIIRGMGQALSGSNQRRPPNAI